MSRSSRPLIPTIHQAPVTDPFANTFENSNIHERNSYYWGRQQYAALSEAFRTNAFSLDNFNNLKNKDYKLARMRHWLYRTNRTLARPNALSLERSSSPDGSPKGKRSGAIIPAKGLISQFNK